MAIVYNKLAPTDGLVLCLDSANRRSYPGTGTNWFDLSGNGNNGTLINSPSFANINGGEIIFDGIDDYIGINNFTGSINTFTISHFIYLNTTQNTRTIFSNYGSNNLGWVTGIRDDQNNIFKFYLGNGNHLYSTIALQNLIWYHIAVTYNNGNSNIYINGNLNASSSTSIAFASSYFGNDIGRLGDARQYFNGKISQIQIYNRALTNEEILTLYNVSRRRFL